MRGDATEYAATPGDICIESLTKSYPRFMCNLWKLQAEVINKVLELTSAIL